ncbi:hypothetical protein MA6G0728R_5303 [Mycobacteroides abscessus 6G-0728-R]|nr:hypothetical protein MA6G0728S_5273 [Mycobacteroides abscessus 6G-0728-S]EIU74814.1 hypothetical protein MA6G1108_5462 [Mycobacteroides abscessus 6G-1108]EIV03023.1 hypothetical protein MA6G0728R_5303 [Mycobacteroides abscessus 6G-0728-R]
MPPPLPATRHRHRPLRILTQFHVVTFPLIMVSLGSLPGAT